MSGFASLEARVAASGMRLANAEAIVGSTTVSGIFERTPLILNGVEGTHPTFTLQSSDVAAAQIRYGTQLRIPSAGQAAWGSQEFWSGNFVVRGLEPDGAGITVLVLEAV